MAAMHRIRCSLFAAHDVLDLVGCLTFVALSWLALHIQQRHVREKMFHKIRCSVWFFCLTGLWGWIGGIGTTLTHTAALVPRPK